MLCIPTVTVEEVAVFARLCLETAEYADLPEGERDICLAALSAATGFVKNYTGIKLDETAAREKTAEYDVAEELGYAVKLDTNGTNPDMLEALAQEGLLDYAAMDIKNSPDRYAETCGGVDLLGPVKRSAALLMAGAVDYEFRTTVCAPLHTPEEMAGIGRWLKGAKRYFLQPFVDSGELVGSGMKPLTKEEIEALRDSVLPDIPSTQIRGQ